MPYSHYNEIDIKNKTALQVYHEVCELYNYIKCDFERNCRIWDYICEELYNDDIKIALFWNTVMTIYHNETNTNQNKN